MPGDPRHNSQVACSDRPFTVCRHLTRNVWVPVIGIIPELSCKSAFEDVELLLTVSDVMVVPSPVEVLSSTLDHNGVAVQEPVEISDIGTRICAIFCFQTKRAAEITAAPFVNRLSK